MKKILILIFLYIILVPKIIYAYTYNENGLFSVKIYGTIYGDIFYSHGTGSMLNNFYGTGLNNSNTITTNASKGSTKLGINVKYNKVELNFEAGITDPVRRFFLKYNIDEAKKHYILAGRDTNIVYYYFGQFSNDGQSLNDYGTVISRRKMQLRYGYNGFEVALIMPYIGFSNADDMAYNKKDKNSQYIFNQIPRIEMAYHYKKNNTYLKPLLSYGVYLYNVNNTAYSAHEYTFGLAGKSVINNLSIDYMLYFGQNMYLNSSMGGYSGFSSAINPVYINGSNVEINNYYSSGGGLAFSYKYNKFLFQTGAGINYNLNKTFTHIQTNTGTYINVRYYFTDIFSILLETAYLGNIYDTTNTNKGYTVITGGMLILSF